MSKEARAKLHHVALGAENVERVAAFYADIFDLKICARHHYEDGALRSIWLEMGGTVLMVEHIEELTRPVDSTKKAAPGVERGLFLLAFAAEDLERRQQIEARAAAAGHPVESRTEFTAYLRDPEGNRVAVSSYPTT